MTNPDGRGGARNLLTGAGTSDRVARMTEDTIFTDHRVRLLSLDILASRPIIMSTVVCHVFDLLLLRFPSSFVVNTSSQHSYWLSKTTTVVFRARHFI